MRVLRTKNHQPFKAHLVKAKRPRRILDVEMKRVEADTERELSALQRSRVQHLYEISKLLTRFDSVEATLPAVLLVTGRALSLRSAMALLETAAPGQPRVVTWRPPNADPGELRVVKAHLTSAYGYLVPSGVTINEPPSTQPAASTGERHEPSAHCILLPLAADHRPIFGGLHLAAADPFDELDLVFANAVANQMAVAIARQATVEARQATIEGERAEAVTQRAFAEVSRREADLRRAAAEKAEERIRDEFAFARDVTVSLGEGVIVVDLAERITLINPAAEALLACPAPSALQQPVRDLVRISSGDGAVDESPFALTLRRGELVRCDESSFSSQGRATFPAVYTCSPLWQGGKVSGAVLAFRDITEAKRAEKKQRVLAQVSALLASSLEHQETLSAVAHFSVPLLADLCFIDEIGEDGLVQRAVVVFADAKKQRALEESVRSYSPRPGWQTPEARVLQSGAALLVAEVEEAASDEHHARVMRAAGLRSMLCVPMLARGRTLGVLSFITAESNRRYSPHDRALAEEIGYRAGLAIDNSRLYEHARRATRCRDDLLAVVAHDLKNPLGVILMSLGLLRSTQPDRRTRSRKPLAAIQRSAQRMDRLIRDLLDAAGIDAGHLPIKLRRVSVRALVAEAVETLSTLAYAKSIQIETLVDSGLPAIVGDSGRLQQVLSNLIGNALKFTPVGGTVHVGARRSADAVTFSVTDTGPGVQEADRPHIFDRFWQARRTAQFGSGLGLFIVKGIVEAHGGSVWLQSQVGAGSTFFFTVPAATEDRDLLLDSAPGHTEVAGEPISTVDCSSRVDELMREAALRERELQAALESARVARSLAEQAAISKNDFTSLVSHELRGPLTALELLVERLHRDKDVPPSPAQQPIIGRMRGAVARLSALIESMVLHGLLQRGKITTKVETFGAAAVACAAIEELRPYADEKGLELRLVAAGDLPPLSSDRELVLVILINLIRNAIKFTQRGFVEVSVLAEKGQHRLMVRDSGPGIPAADRIRIFEPFEQIGNVKQKHVPGLGLGLALVREVAVALGGGIDLTSASEQGSVFTVTLPPLAQVLLECSRRGELGITHQHSLSEPNR